MALCWAFTATAAGLDDDFLAARDAARVGDSKRLEQLLPKFKGHLLEPYVRYWRLQQRLAARDPTEIRAFLAQHRDTPLSDYLRRDWLKVLGENGQWELFDAELPGLVNEDLELTDRPTIEIITQQLVAFDKYVRKIRGSRSEI